MFISPEVAERLVSRTCAWCGAVVPYSGRGRPRLYCSKSHRNRAWELRTAATRAGDGTRTSKPVREIIERTTVVEAPPEAARATLPGNAREWCAMLGHLTAQLRGGQLRYEHWHHGKILDAIDAARGAFDAAHPGGLKNIPGRR